MIDVKYRLHISCIFLLMCFAFSFGCEPNNKPSTQAFTDDISEAFHDSKPATRWWWFATEIQKADIKHQLDWMKEKNFGGVEIAWVYPLYRYKRMYEKKYNRYYPVDTTAQEWLSDEWQEVVKYTKNYADEIGIQCDFTFGSAWPVAGKEIGPELTTKVYGDTSFRQTLTFAWAWPDTFLVIDHLNPKAFETFANPITNALKSSLTGKKSSLFTDSWEIKMNNKYKVWTDGFEEKFKKKFNYDIIPFMDQNIDSFPDVRYDYMLLVEELVIDGFYKPYVKKCEELGAWSRVQCLASPTDIMHTYGLVDIPESEALLNNPLFSRIVSSAACLAEKPLVSSESFTCMYGFPSTYLREEQTADLKLLADALFAQGINQHVYHGLPYNPIGSDSLEFFATTYFGPGGNLEEELASFNKYIQKVSSAMRRGKSYSDVAVYLPYEDAVMKGPLPKEKWRVWVWGEYELRYTEPPTELEGHHPIWINRTFLESATLENGQLRVGDARFNSLYIDVEFMDIRALKRVLTLAKAGLPICLKKSPKQPGESKNKDFNSWLEELNSLSNVTHEWSEKKNTPLIKTKENLRYWARCLEDESINIFIAQPLAYDVVYPMYCGQSAMSENIEVDIEINYKNNIINHKLIFKPYQSILLNIDNTGTLKELDISFIPKDPEVKPKEEQKMYF